MKVNLVSSGFFFLSSLLWVSCQNKNNNDVIEEGNVYFDSKAATERFELLPIKQQAEEIIDVIATPFDNKQEVEDWLLLRIPVLFDQAKEADLSLLASLIQELDLSDYEEAAYKVAVTSNKHNKKYNHEKLTTHAAVNLVNYFVRINEKDSIKKYIAVIEDGMAFTQNYWVTLNYYLLKGYLNKINGNFFEATKNYHQALAFVNPSDSINQINVYHDLIGLYLEMKFYDKANFYANKVLENVDYNDISIYWFNTLGLALTRGGDFEKAEKIFLRFLGDLQLEQVNLLHAQTLANFGNLKRRQANIEEALYYIEKSDSICNFLDFSYGIVINQINRAEVFYDIEDFYRSQYLLNSIESMILDYDIPAVTIAYYELRYRVCDSLGLIELANQYYRIYREEKDQYLGDLPRSIISEWELTNERENSLKQQSALEFSLEREVKSKYRFAFVLTLVVLLLTLYVSIIKRKAFITTKSILLEKQQLAHDLERKSKELLTDTLNAVKMYQLKVNLQQEISELLPNLPKTYHNLLAPLRQKLKVTNNHTIFIDFEKRFLGVYESFYDNILAINPALTPNELKICAFIKLNMNTKDIAVLTNKSIGTIENNRTQIRKKLNLASNENLQKFLLTI